MARQLELPLGERGEAPRAERSGEASRAASGDGRSGTDHLMEWVVERGNAQAALKRVRQNQGSPGGDGMTVDDLPGHLRAHWVTIKAQLLAGTYQPQPVKRQPIPKPGGGVRELGIPTRARPVHPAGHPAGPATAASIRRSRSTATASGRGAGRTTRSCGAAVHPGGPAVGRGRGPGEVLRPGQPRRADGAAGQADRGPAGAAD